MSKVTRTSFYPHPEDQARLEEIAEKTAIIRTLESGRFSDGLNMSGVFHEGVAAALAAIEAAWTPEHEGMLRAGLTSRRAMSEPTVAESRARGFGPGTPLEAKKAEAVRLSGEGVSESLIAGLFGVTQQRADDWIRKAAEAARSGDSEKAAEARRLYGEGVPVRQIAARLGVSWQKATSWCHKPPLAAPVSKTWAWTRSGPALTVEHVTPGGVPFLAAPEAKP